MSNGIAKRQNEEASTAKLAAAYQLDSEAARWDRWKFVCGVGFPFLLCLLKTAAPENPLLTGFSCALSLVSMAALYVMAAELRHTRDMTAAVRQNFDLFVYQMPWNRGLFGRERKLSRLTAEKSRVMFSGGERPENPYPLSADELPLEEGILACQKENCIPDRRPRVCYRACAVGGIVSLCVLAMGLGFFRQETLPMLLTRLAFIAPMLGWLSDTAAALNADLERLSRLESVCHAPGHRTMEELQELQAELYEYRKNSLPVPRFFYPKESGEMIPRRAVELVRRP